MLKIEEVHASAGVQGEYVVLQNQGLLTVNLRGWALCTNAFLEGDDTRIAEEMYIFREDEQIKPYTRVVLFTGKGDNGWVPTIDGRLAYCAYWGRQERIWTITSHVHVLHLFTSRKVCQPSANVAASSL
jgi:hypothetical protein